MIKDYVTAKERLNFNKVKTLKELIWSNSYFGYSIELNNGKMLLKNTPMTKKRLHALIKNGEQVLKEVKTRELLTPSTWSWNV